MKPRGWNPTRRNRNIGTDRAGHGQSNRLVIPESWNDIRAYWCRLKEPVYFELNGFTFLVEPCHPEFMHSVTVDDVVQVLSLLPRDDAAGVRIVALRQPSRKQTLLSAVWGRLAYFADFGRVQGPAIIIEAMRLNEVFEYPLSLPPDAAAELDRIREDGHVVTKDNGRRTWRVETTPDSVRHTQLYRTVPHEVGHLVHYVRDVIKASGGDRIEERRLDDLYFTKPSREKEDFAHRYAREFYERVCREGRVPFDRMIDLARIKRLGLKASWFGIPTDGDPESEPPSR